MCFSIFRTQNYKIKRKGLLNLQIFKTKFSTSVENVVKVHFFKS